MAFPNAAPLYIGGNTLRGGAGLIIMGIALPNAHGSFHKYGEPNIQYRLQNTILLSIGTRIRYP